MKEKLLEILNSSDKALSIIELKDLLNLKETSEITSLIELLNNEEKLLSIYRTNKDKYMLFDKSHLKKGKLSVHEKGYAFLLQEEDDIYIDKSNLNNAINDDFVIVEIISTSGNKKEGRVLRILKREFGLLVGEYYTQNNKGYVKLDDKKSDLLIEIEEDSTKDVVEGHKVVVEVIRELGGNKLLGQIIRIIGHKNDVGVDIRSIIYSYGFNDVFSEEVEEELKNISNEVKEEELIDRRDLRNEQIFTIDGDDTKDIDDAISIKKIDENTYELGVHIADVTYYVRPGTNIYKEAYNRGTSVYLVDRVVPMLPHKLSNGICSLNPNVDRLTQSCVMKIDKEGNIKDYEIFPSVIKSRIQMTYKKVNKILENNELVEGYEPYTKDLFLMKELADILRKNKIQRGYLDFETDEAKILVDENLIPTDIVLRDRGVGEKLIEDFMIAANETVATHIFYLELPFIYRVHDIPKETKVKELFDMLGSLGYKINSNPRNIHPKEMQKVLNYLKDKPEFTILSQQLLRAMQKAVYQKENIGHYGLASKIYTHFTSPIRRFPDTTVHELLRTYIYNNDQSSKTIEYWNDLLEELSNHCSLKERDAVECEREVESMKMAEYMMNHIGEEYEGMISGITNFGIFVQLPNLIEGLVHVTNLEGDFYNYDEKTMSMIGERTKKAYKIGTKVRIKVKAASKINQTIDFEFIEEKKINENVVKKNGSIK